MQLAKHHEVLIIINKDLEQKVVSPSGGVGGNLGIHVSPEFFSAVTESAVRQPRVLVKRG